MTTDFTSNDEMTTADDFKTALGRVILTAHRNDIDPRGSWEYRTDEENPNMEVMIVELAE